MKPVRVLTLAWVALGSGLATWLVLTTLKNQGVFLPLTSRLVVVVIVGLGLFVGLRGWLVRRWVANKSQQHMSSLQAARTVVMAQTGALVGALLLGWYVAQAIVFFTNLAGNNVSRFRMSLASAAAALLLAVISVVAQRWCRRPPEPDEIDRGQQN